LSQTAVEVRDIAVWRFIDRKDKATDEIENEFLLCSRSVVELSLDDLLQADRD
jgi:hypothetical protein